MAKKIKFNMRLDGNPVRNIEGIRDNFSIDDVLEVYQSGVLQRWLKSRGFDDAYYEVENIENKNNPILELVKIFDINFDEMELKEIISSIEQLKNNREKYKLLDKGVVDNKKIIENYHLEYNELLEKATEYKDDFNELKK
ncbi:hypothetical protein [Leucothrix mucor]|uniref:hypothetical protein n=1 Tax=Leucothrix mucor TaxID=45248 RepID=UPI0003B62C5B|nr:hypothetical protein [Leucothrix mucor]